MSPFIRIPLLITLLLALALPGAARGGEQSLVDEIEEIRLDNGLRIFVLERDFSPTFSAIYQFKVGGAADPKGRSGIAHLLEHMMFKGSESIGTLDRKKEKRIMARLSELWHELDRERTRCEEPFGEADEERIAELESEIESLAAEHKAIIVKNEYDELLTRAGGVAVNAGTSWDFTRYFVQLPANQLEFWFRIESERLTRPVFREFYSERDVVREERRLRYENRAEGMVTEAINGLLFRGHPYTTPVIGWPSEVERLKREDAEDYFRTYYSPGNCVMVLVGDLDRGEVERLAKKHLGKWKPQEFPPLLIAEAPEPRGERRQTVRFDAEPSITLGWNTVPDGLADNYPLVLLARLLGGMSSSRLDRDLVNERRIATSVGAYNYGGLYEGSFEVYGQPQGEHTLDELEGAILEHVRRVRDEGVSEEELERAKVAFETWRVNRLESNLWLAFSIGSTVGQSGDLDYIDEFEERISAVTAEQVQDVAQRYLTPSRLCVVPVLRPEDGDGGAQVTGGGSMAHAHGSPPGDRGAAHSKGYRKLMDVMESAPPVEIAVPVVGEDVERLVLGSGITVFLKEDHAVPSVSMGFSWLGGSNTTPVEELAPAQFASGLLGKGGTEELTPEELEVRLDELGMRFNVWIGSTQSGARFWSLSRNFAESFDLAMDILTEPRLDTDRLEVQKGRYISNMKRRYDRPSRAVRLLSNHVLRGDHPRLGYTPAKTEVEAVAVADVSGIVDRYLGPDNLFVTVVGDFERDALLAGLEERLGAWSRAQDSERDWLERTPVAKPGVYVLEKEIPQPAVLLSQEIDIDRTAPPEEHAAVEILNEILGGSGFRSRLMERLRSDEGLTYGVYSRCRHQGREEVPGSLSIQYQTQRDAVARSIEIVLEVYQQLLADGVTVEEVAEQIQTWRNRFIFRFENRSASIQRLMALELDDRPYGYDQEQLEWIEAVTVADVNAAARKYLDPADLSICVFGKLTPEDEAALAETYGLTKLAKEEVFSGGY